MKVRVIVILLIVYFGFSFKSQLYQFVYPNYFPEPEYLFENNALSEEKIELGRHLFYDPILSSDNTISCASCHSPYNAFAHTDHSLSHGINDRIGTRNAPALFNLAWNKSFMWDGAINHLDMQALAPLNHQAEMNEDLKNVIDKLQKKKIYPDLFYHAFGDSIITGEHFLKSIAQFQLSLISAKSKYDQMKLGELNFTEQENNGYKLFKNNCNSCHIEPLFTSHKFANNGINVDSTLNDFGRWNITKMSSDSLLFKIPTLRNLKYTFPYMHDGRFRKLKEVLNHYSSGIYDSKTLSKELKIPIKLTSREKVDLIAFLLTLNDKTFVFDKKHQFPITLLQ